MAVATILLLLAAMGPTASGDDLNVGGKDGAFHAGAGETSQVDEQGTESIASDTDDTRWELGAECTADQQCIGEPCEDPTAREYWLYGYDSTGELTSAGMTCITDGQPALTATLISRAFRRLPMPEPTLRIQPPGGRTLVNFETNFFTRERTLQRIVRLLGRRVEFRIWVDTYRWHFGDGTVEDTAGPGAAYPALDITHNYTRVGRYSPRLTVTYVADYRVDGGGWSAVDGAVTVAGSPSGLRAIEATPTLVGYDG